MFVPSYWLTFFKCEDVIGMLFEKLFRQSLNALLISRKRTRNVQWGSMKRGANRDKWFNDRKALSITKPWRENERD